MQRIDFEGLRNIGLTLAVAQGLLNLLEHRSGQPMRVIEVHRETLQVHDGRRAHGARLLPAFARLLAERDDAIAVGDWVLLEPDAHGGLWVVDGLVPLTALVRRDAEGRRHAVVSNVDTALLVMGLDADFSPRRLERFLALVQGSGVAPVVVLSKPDVCPDPAAAVAQLRGRIPAALPIFALDGRTPHAVDALKPWLGAGQTLVLLGSSGAGKSTLANTLLGRAVQDTGAVREGDGRGRHTTTARTLLQLPDGACLIDTPGVRTLRPDADEATLEASFGDIARLALQCRFRDCQHQDEPGCAVRDGVGGDRLRNFHKLQRELRRDTLTALERRRQLSEWKQRGRVGRANLRAKRGE